MDVRIMNKVLEKMQFNGQYDNITFGPDIVATLDGANENMLPNLIILDIGLPGMTGLEVLSALRKIPHTMGIPVLMSTGSGSLRDYRECMALGANGYIRKDADAEKFFSISSRFINVWCHFYEQSFL